MTSSVSRWVVLWLGALSVTASAQVAVDPTTAETRNDLPVDVVVLAYSPASRTFATQRVPARSRVPAAPSADAVVLSMEPVTTEVGRREMFRTCSVAKDAVVDVRKVVEDLKAIDFLETASAKDKIEAASTIARLELEQRFDERQTFRDDPLRNELLRQQERYAPEAQRLYRQRHEAAEDVIADVATMALAWATVNQERLSILRDEYQSLAPLIQQAQMAVQIREHELSAYDASAAAWHAYSSTVARALDERGPNAGVAIAKTQVRKSCPQSTQGWDWFELEGPNMPGVSALIAELSFDGGVKQTTVMRRLASSTRWAGRMDWPANGTTAKVRVRWPGSTKWYDMDGTMSAGRQSMVTALDEARRAAREIEKKMKDTNFRSVGGDTAKTIPVF